MASVTQRWVNAGCGRRVDPHERILLRRFNAYTFCVLCMLALAQIVMLGLMLFFPRLVNLASVTPLLCGLAFWGTRELVVRVSQPWVRKVCVHSQYACALPMLYLVAIATMHGGAMGSGPTPLLMQPTFLFLLAVPQAAAFLLSWRASVGWSLAGITMLTVAFVTSLQATDGRVAELSMYYVMAVATLGQIMGYAVAMTRITDVQVAQLETQASELVAAKAAADAANASKSQFLADMSHEIRTPMNGVLGMTEILLRSPLDADQRDVAGTIRSSGESLLTIVNDILDFSKIEAGRMDLETIPVDVRATLEEVAILFAERAQAKGVELIVDVGADVPETFLGDPTRLRQIVANLVGNAVKFTSDGEIVVRAAVAPVAVAPDADATGRIRIEVADTGIGMTPEQQSRLFAAFAQADASTSRRFGGTGLGLAICRRLAELMGGAITVTSAEGAGSTFCVEVSMPSPQPAPVDPDWLRGRRVAVDVANATLRRIAARDLALVGAEVVPSARAEVQVLDAGSDAGEVGIAQIHLVAMGAPRAAADRGARLTRPLRRHLLWAAVADALGVAPRAVASVPGAGGDAEAVGDPALVDRRILVVDDAPVNRRIAARFLEICGCRVDSAGDGDEALELLREAGSRFDAVLMDVQMPVLDGIAATRQWREDEASSGRPRVPIVAMTGGSTPEEQRACHAAGMDASLPKPFTLPVLVATLVGVLDPGPEAVEGADDRSAWR